jgi:hypothetical protein
MEAFVQRLFAVGPGTLPDTCIVDVGGLGRWLFETTASADALVRWKVLVDVLRTCKRRLIWVASLPGESPSSFGATDLSEVVAVVTGAAIAPVVTSSESLTSLLVATHAPKVPEPVAVISAQIIEYPEQLVILDGVIAALLDLGTGHVHTSLSQFRHGPGEPALIPLVQAAVRPDPADPRRRPPASKGAPRYTAELDRVLQEPFPSDAAVRSGAAASVPEWLAKSLWKNLERVQERELEIIGERGGDPSARAALQTELAGRSGATSVLATPIVVAPLRLGPGAAWTLAAAPAMARLKGAHSLRLVDDGALARFLKDLVSTHPKCWVAPRALDLLGFMVDHGLALPESIVDPAHMAFALCPDDLDSVLTHCPSRQRLDDRVAAWLWDVKRQAAPPPDVAAAIDVLPGLMVELRALTAAAQLDSVVEDDVARTVPTLASIERGGAWVRSGLHRLWSVLQTSLDRLELQFRPFLGDADPYTASAQSLVLRLLKQGITEAPGPVLHGLSWSDSLERVGATHQGVAALLEARHISSIQAWVARLERAGGRLRGQHFPEVTGRWGLNKHAIQSMPKHSALARQMRSYLEGPPGTTLVSADFSSFELRLIAGLSRDPLLLDAAQQDDAIGHLAKKYFGDSSGTLERQLMKNYMHPFNYGAGEGGFLKQQVSTPILKARGDFQTLTNDLGTMLSWRKKATATALQRGIAETRGGWQRDPRRAKRRLTSDRVEDAIVSTEVQGLAADILRWCLRELSRTLPSLDGQMVFQNHDEIYVAVAGDTAAVRNELSDVLERRVVATGLVPPGVRLVAKIKEGANWGEIA